MLLAVHWSRVDDVLKQAGDLSGTIIVCCSLPMSADDTRLVVAHTSSGAEALAKKVRKAHVVSAFSTVPSEALFDVYRRKSTDPAPAEPLVMPGTTGRRSDVAARLMRDVGFTPVDAGPLRHRRVFRAVLAGRRTTRVRGGSRDREITYRFERTSSR